ncbi:MAG: hypothetical protein AAB633_00265 [Patescibacteria group bacterium]
MKTPCILGRADAQLRLPLFKYIYRESTSRTVQKTAPAFNFLPGGYHRKGSVMAKRVFVGRVVYVVSGVVYFTRKTALDAQAGAR